MGAGDFSIALFPDTQCELINGMWQAKYTFCVEHKAELNIKAVLGLGDIVDDVHDTASWEWAKSGWDVLKADIPILPIHGNHDMDGYYSGVSTYGRGVDTYLSHFNPSVYLEGCEFYGGCYDDAPENFYVTFSAEGVDYVAIGMEFYPRDAAISWAQGIISANAAKKIIIVTHGYLGGEGELIPNVQYGLDGNSGSDVWTELVKVNPNIILVLCGHIPAFAVRSSAADDSHTIHQILSKYTLYNDGNGFVTLLTFRTSTHKLEVMSVSAYNGDIDDVDNPYTSVYELDIA